MHLYQEIEALLKSGKQLKDCISLVNETSFDLNDLKETPGELQSRKGCHYDKKLLYLSDLIEVFLIHWKTEARADLHNHSEHGCILSMLQGKVQEEIYCPNQKQYIKTSILSKGDTGYMCNEIGYHKILNLWDEDAYSLHIYAPPHFKTQYFSEG